MVIIVLGACVSGPFLLVFLVPIALLVLLVFGVLGSPDLGCHVLVAGVRGLCPMALWSDPWPTALAMQTTLLVGGVLGTDALLRRTRASKPVRYLLLALIWILLTFTSNTLIRALPLGLSPWILGAPK